ncbi:MAG: porin [Kofleriaceae bacterium]
MTRAALVLAVLAIASSRARADDPTDTMPEHPTPAPAGAVPAPAPDSSEDDAAALVLDASRDDDKLNIYGYADASWRVLAMKRSALSANYFPKENTFLVGNLNLYLTKNLAHRWRTLIEVRFLYAPAASANADGTLTHTTAPDPADLQRPISWGAVSIERAYLEYDVNEHLTIQAGSFLTPYGIWNVDHGSPAIIPVNRPYIIGESLFPQQQTGIHAYGKHPVGEYQLGYHLTLSNGRGPFQGFRDLDENKAIGARVELETAWLGGVHLGLSTYRGRFTDRPADQIGSDADGNLINITPVGTAYDEASYGADALVHHGAWHMQAEIIANDRRYRDGARELTRGGFLADGRYLGAYALAGYRFDRLWQVMPFATLEVNRPRASADLGDDTTIYQAAAGFNFRPVPSVALKINYLQATIRSPALDATLRAVSTQAAWAF